LLGALREQLLRALRTGYILIDANCTELRTPCLKHIMNSNRFIYRVEQQPFLPQDTRNCDFIRNETWLPSKLILHVGISRELRLGAHSRAADA
jgi:hypothetical protein